MFAVQVEEVRTHHAALTYDTIDFSPLCQAVWKRDGTLLEVTDIVDDPLVFLIQYDVLEHLEEAFVANSIKGFLVIDKADVDFLLVLYASFAKHPQSENGISPSFVWHEAELTLGDFRANLGSAAFEYDIEQRLQSVTHETDCPVLIAV